MNIQPFSDPPTGTFSYLVDPAQATGPGASLDLTGADQ